MPGPDDAADLWPNKFGLTPADRTRMEAHSDVLLEIAAAAIRQANPGEPVDDAQAAYVAGSVLARRAALTRAELAENASLLLTDAALTVGALREDGPDQLIVHAERCRQALRAMWRSACDRLEQQLAETAPADARPEATH